MRMAQTMAAAFASLVAPLAQTSVVAGPYLEEIEIAQERWTSSHPSNYAYTLQVGVGPFGFNSVRIKVDAGSCSAVTRFEFGSHKEPWKKVPCDGYQMDDLFERLRMALARGPASYQAAFDPALGYVKQASIDPSLEIADDDWSSYLTRFKALK